MYDDMAGELRKGLQIQKWNIYKSDICKNGAGQDNEGSIRNDYVSGWKRLLDKSGKEVIDSWIQ